MSSAFDEMRLFKIIPYIPVDSKGRKVLKLNTQQKIQIAQFENITVSQLEERFLNFEKIGFWKRDSDGETFIINPSYCKPDFKNLERLEDDNRNKGTTTEASTEE